MNVLLPIVHLPHLCRLQAPWRHDFILISTVGSDLGSTYYWNINWLLMLPFRKASVLQIWELWGNFSESSECTGNPYLPRPVSPKGSTHTPSAWKLCFSTGPCPTPCLSWAAGKPILSLGPLLLLTTARLDLRRALAAETSLAITGWMLPNPGCCQQTCSALLPLVPCRHRHGLSSTFGSSSFTEPSALAAPPQPARARTQAQMESPGPRVEGAWLGPQVGQVWATSAYR